MGKLDVANVSKAIHRFGTIPKDVQIGAYLQSLEHEHNNHNDLPSAEEQSSRNGRASVSSCPPNVSEAGADGTFTPSPAQAGGDGMADDSDPGIKQEPNLRPSAFVKSQSQHGLRDNGVGGGVMKGQYSGMLQRHKSDLTDSEASRYEAPWDNMFTQRLHNPATENVAPKPKPSPRFSRMIGDGGSEPSSQVPSKASPKVDGGPPVTAADANGGQRPPPPTSFGTDRSKLDFSNSPNSLSSFKTFGKPGVVKETNLDLVHAEAMLAAATDSLQVTPTDNATSESDTGIYKPVLPLMKGAVITAPPDKTSDPMTSSMIGEGRLGSSAVEEGDSSSPVTIERILEASERLRGCIDKLAVAGNKSSTNFMLLSEEVSDSK